jgi:hypothetical protein
MIHPTPTQVTAIEQSGIPTIRSECRDHETTFVILHPFLKIKPWYNITFETGNWPTKKQLLDGTQNITWAEIIRQAGLHDISELDRLLAYLHCERRTADREGWIKLMTVLDKNGIIPAEVDYLPASITNPLLAAIQRLGYATVEEYELGHRLRKVHRIHEILLSEEQDFYSLATVKTPDCRIVFSTGFDKRFTCLSAAAETVKAIVETAEPEGFYCNSTTRPEWSVNEQTENLIDWSSPERKQNFAL